MKINANLSSIIVQSSLKTSTNGLNQAIERMTTGFKINHAKDNAANYSISTKLSSKISGYQIAEDNALMGLDLVQTASSSLETMSNLTSRLRSLTTQAQNGTYGYKSIDAINSEARSIVQELNRIKQTTEYNGINLLSSSGESVASSGQFIEEIIRRDTSGMTTLASVDETTSLTSGTYSISSAEELAKLAAMTDNGLIGENTEFVLANDIDLSAYSTSEGLVPIGTPSKIFWANFDVNGYVISNPVMGNDEVGDLVAYGSCAKLDKAYYTDTTGQTNCIGYGAPMSGTAQLVTMDGLHKLISQGILPDYKSKTGINSSS